MYNVIIECAGYNFAASILYQSVNMISMQVGIGGRYDCTNVIQKPAVVGISHLGYDHTAILGQYYLKRFKERAGCLKISFAALLLKYAIRGPTYAIYYITNESILLRLQLSRYLVLLQINPQNMFPMNKYNVDNV